MRRKSRFSKRRKPRTFWLDTFQDGVPQYIDVYAGFDSDPGHEKVKVVPIIRQRTPTALEDVSSVLQAKDEGFRLRRIVGDLELWPAIYSGTDLPNNYLNGIWTHITWGIMVHPITEGRQFDNFNAATGQYLFNPSESRSMSDPWLIRRTESLIGYPDEDGPHSDFSIALRESNRTHTPFGTVVDINVNRRVGPEEDVSAFFTWNSPTSLPEGGALKEPAYLMHLRMLVSR